ncbi:hypothetical protein ACJJTC_010179, partial [Scirpophaga incertulas]
NINASCIPTAGMYQLLQKNLNHSTAAQQCRNMSGVLADAASEQRTDALAQLLAGASVYAAHVYMTRNNGSDFYSANGHIMLIRGNSLQCTTYRAWAPGHPRRYPDKFGCVVLTRRRMWQSVSCSKPYPALCELFPGGPYKKGTIFTSKEHENDYSSTIDNDSKFS